jgi:hypothetical protein
VDSVVYASAVRVSVVLVAVVVLLGGCRLSEPEATSRTLLLAPSEVPRGFVIESAVAGPVNTRAVQTLYARAGSDPEHDPALLVAEVGEDADVGYSEQDSQSVAGLSAAPGKPALLAHLGDYTVIGWYRSTERTTVVAARGLTDAQVARAARAAKIADDATPTVPLAGLPAGFEKVADAPLLPRQRGATEQEIWFVSQAGGRKIRVSMSDLLVSGRRIDRFLATFPGVHANEGSVERTVDGRNVFVRGAAPQSVLNALARSVVAVSAGRWDDFRRRATQRS